MVFIRGPHTDASIWRHFRGDGDGFTFGERDGVCETIVMANADRVVELFLALAEHLPPAVAVEVHDHRSLSHWRGEDLALVDVRDAVARIKGALATFAGAELTLTGSDDQLTITPNLELFVYGRTDRWLYLLQGKGLRRRRELRPRSWRLAAGEFAPAPAMSSSLADAVNRLGLERVSTEPAPATPSPGRATDAPALDADRDAGEVRP
ncbi:MAG: hypothetical protein IT359_19255 [Gemmatimonadaceae bacterium]|nr:hypothetical protein [Gemmatimonadaceae bacterium]